MMETNLLYVGSEFLVKGAVSTAFFAIKSIIIGLTIVAFATSAPEFIVSLVAAGKGSGRISVGNIILVLGISHICFIIGTVSFFQSYKN